jgi:TetR/AcrR family transcriptional regulator, tetracycline repressor protein
MSTGFQEASVSPRSDRSEARTPVTRARLLAEALRIADAEGAEKLSMRKLGRACGVEAMSLYHHVPDKAAILDGISEAVFAEVELPETPADTPWQEELAQLTRAMRDALLRHPGALAVIATRPAFHAPGLAVIDRLVGALRRAGFDPLEALYASRVAGLFVTAFALAECGRSPVEPADVTAAGWQSRIANAPAEGLPDYAAAMGQVPFGAWSSEDMFELGLRAFLDGLAARLERGDQPNTSG